jgi:hypothetical protein
MLSHHLGQDNQLSAIDLGRQRAASRAEGQEHK